VIKNKSNNLIILALLTFVTLYTFVSYFFINSSVDNSKQLNLLENHVVLVYGEKLESMEKSYSLTLDSHGEAVIILQNKPITASDYSHITYQIKDLPLNYSIELLWVDTHVKPHFNLLNQATGSSQTNLLPDKFIDEVQQVGLRFSPQFHLGIEQTNLTPIIIEQFSLTNQNFSQTYFSLLHYWLDYSPWNYKSINHLPLKTNIPFYAQAHIFILTWLMLTLLIYSVRLKKPSVFVIFVALSWMFIDILYLQNQRNQLKWLDSLSNNISENIPDKRLFTIAQNILKIINSENDYSKLKKNKVFIIANNKYQKLRLNYHLSPANSGYLNTLKSFEKSHIKTGDFILSYNNKNHPKHPRNNKLVLRKLTLNVSELESENDYSLMQVIK